MKRVLVLINLTAKRTEPEWVAVGKLAVAKMQAHLDQMAPVFTSKAAFGFVGVTDMDCKTLLITLDKELGLRSGDNISVLELAENIISSHRGLMEWQNSTVTVSVLAGLARQK